MSGYCIDYEKIWLDEDTLRLIPEPTEGYVDWTIGSIDWSLPITCIPYIVLIDTPLQDCIQEQVSKILSKHIKKGKPLFDYATQYRALCYSNFITKGIKPILSKHISVV